MMRADVIHQEPGGSSADVPEWDRRGGRFGLRELWLILRQYRLTVFGCALVAVVLALVLIARITPMYEATASVRIDQQQSQLPVLDALRSLPDNSIGTEIEMLQSRALARAVVDSLGLAVRIDTPAALRSDAVFSRVVVASDTVAGPFVLERAADGGLQLRDSARVTVLAEAPADGPIKGAGLELHLTPAGLAALPVGFDVVSPERAAGAIASAVSVEQRNRNADIVEVHYQGTDPELVRDVTNSLVARFLSERQQSRKAAARSTATFVREQIAKVSGLLTKAEDGLRRYREQAGIVSMDDQASSEVRRRAELLGQRNSYEAERVALDRLLADARRGAGDSATAYRDLVAFPSLLRNQAVSGLLQSLAQIEDRRADLRLRRRDEDPDVQALTERAAELERQLRGLALGYQQGLSNQVAAIDGILAASDRKMGAIPAQQIRVAQMEREVRGLAQIYEQLQTRLKEAEIAEAAGSDPSVQLVDAAVLPRSPVSPRRTLIVLFALALGTTTGFVIALLRELLNATVRTRGDAMLALGLPVLGIVPRIVKRRALAGAGGEHARRWLPSRSAGRDEATIQEVMFADVYNRLHTSLLYARAPKRLRVIVLTSPLPSEGKTTSAVNLALTLAQQGMRVVLVDADLRRGKVGHVFGVRRGGGLAEVLAGSLPLDGAIRKAEFGAAARLDYLTAGVPPVNPSQLLASGRLDSVIDELSGRYDRVIIDTPPLNVVVDAAALGAKADAVVLVARVGATPVDALVYAGEQARNAGLEVTGVVLNDVDLDRYGASDSAYKWSAYGSAYYAAAVSES